METSIIAVGNIFINTETGKKCKVREIFCMFYPDNEIRTIVVFRNENEVEQNVNINEVSKLFAKVAGF